MTGGLSTEGLGAWMQGAKNSRGKPTGVAWQVWVDTGGTFTDCVARSPSGEVRRVKVLSSSALRGVVHAAPGPRVRFAVDVDLPDGFFRQATLRVGSAERLIVDSRGADQELTLDSPLAVPAGGCPGQATFGEEAPILAARVATGTPAGRPLPPLALRLATTRGTNALLERRGAPVALFITAGFGDLLAIGSQQRPDLFALAVTKAEPLYCRVIEVEERLRADGTVLRPLRLDALVDTAAAALAAGVDCAAVALLHSYRNDAHEQAVAARLGALGFSHVSVSSQLAARPKIVPRAETAVVNAYLSRVIEGYLAAVQRGIAGGRLQVMTSAGGLIGAASYEPKDSLLSGPAGGVVGAAAAGRRSGLGPLIAFDMGGTSTDVSRVAEGLTYRQTTVVGGARLVAPALAIETVAAGGGSVCWFDGQQVRVGPHSAGADPGPASYGRGGPLTLTDVNLLLGRLSAGHFPIPLAAEAAAAAAASLLAEVRRGGDGELARDALLAGLLAIADERMAEAIRRISIRQGYALEDHTLVAFGGAGAQHACSLATILGLSRVLVPADAGLLSALGLGAARIERFAGCAVLRPLSEVAAELSSMFDRLEGEAVAKVAAEEDSAAGIVVLQRSAEIRLTGQEATLTVEWQPGASDTELTAMFVDRYGERYGYAPPTAAVEVESLRLVAAAAAPGAGPAPPPPVTSAAPAVGRERAWLAGGWGEWPAYERRRLAPGAAWCGPALVWEEHSATVVEGGWNGRIDASGAMVIEREER